MPYPNWIKDEHVVRKNKPEQDTATCLCDAYTAWDGNGVYVQVFWHGSQQKSTIRANRLKAATKEAQS